MWGAFKTIPHIFGKNYKGIGKSLKSTMVAINSIIVFDTETTGLPHLENNKTRITEMAMIGCEVDHIKNRTDFPRIIHKLVFCFNPLKMITPDSTKISGLENELLMNLKPFIKTDAEMLIHFIDRLPSPACIIAHNGNKFDFPILQKQLHSLNITLPDSVYCADSLKGFQDIYPNSKSLLSNTKKIYQRPVRGDVTPKKALPTSTSNDFQISQKKIPLAPRKLFPESSPTVESSQISENVQLNTQTKSNAPVQYKLSSVYEFLHGECYPGGHRAEEDAKALLSCIIKCEKFLNWMNEKAVAFNTIKPL